MNLLKYDYVAMELPNIFMAYRKDLDRLPPKIDNKLEDLAYAVAKKYPQWKLVASKFFPHDGHYLITYMDIYEGDEKLGVIGGTYFRCSRAYEISNHRIGAEKVRGSSTCTGDLSKALKIISKTFGVKTQVENVSEVCSRISEQMRVMRGREGSSLHVAFSDVFSDLRSRIQADWGKYKQMVLDAGVSPQAIEMLTQVRDTADMVEGVYICAERNHGAVVQIRGSEYVVCKTDNPAKTMRKFTSETLPVELKATIGMLKLVDKNSFIPSKGFKYSDEEFYILVEDQVWM